MKFAIVTSTILKSAIFSKGQPTAYHGIENHTTNYKSVITCIYFEVYSNTYRLHESALSALYWPPKRTSGAQ